MAKIGKPETTKELSQFCAKIAQDKIAKGLLILDLTKIETAPADYFVICTAESDAQVKAIVEETQMRIKKFDLQKPSVEGFEGAYWVLIDFFDVVFHIMTEKSRNYYRLEKLWGDADFFEMTEEGELKKFDAKKLYFENSEQGESDV